MDSSVSLSLDNQQSIIQTIFYENNFANNQIIKPGSDIKVIKCNIYDIKKSAKNYNRY